MNMSFWYNQMQSSSTAASHLRQLEWTKSADSNWPVGKNCDNLKAHTCSYAHTNTHTEEKGRLIEVSESNTDGMRGKKLGEKMNQKLWVIVPAQCTQLSIVQVLRASAITAQLMPVAWLRLQLRITTLGPVQKEKKWRAGNSWCICEETMSECGRLKKVWKRQNLSWDIIYLCYLWLTSI